MNKVVIHIRRYKADITIYGDKLVEQHQRTLSNYTESKSLMNVSDPGEFKQNFIVEMGAKIHNQNRSAEIRAIRDRATTIVKLIIFKIE